MSSLLRNSTLETALRPFPKLGGFSNPDFSIPIFWELETVAANRVAAINPPMDDTDPIREFCIEPGSHTDLPNPAEFSPKGSPHGISVSTHIVDMDTIATPFVRTPFPRLLDWSSFRRRTKVQRVTCKMAWFLVFWCFSYFSLFAEAP